MIKTKHTPGPWKVENHRGLKQVWNQNTHVATINLDHEAAAVCDDDANANLIAAAPDLIAFAQSIEARVLLIREAFKSGGRAQLEQLILDMDADAFDLINKATGGAE